MAKEILQATDAGLKQMHVTVSANGTILAISTPTESISLSQKDIEKILVAQHNEANEAKIIARAAEKAYVAKVEVRKEK
jgi:hypothetical protein